MSSDQTLIMSIKSSLEDKMDTGFKQTCDSIKSLTKQVRETNGRVTELERNKIRHDTEVFYLKAAFGTFIVPVVVFLLIRGVSYILNTL